MNLDDKFNLLIQIFQPLDSNIHIDPTTNIKYYSIKITSNKISNWCVVNKDELKVMPVEELVEKYTKIRDLKQKEIGM